jgi:hypothetical protein
VIELRAGVYGVSTVPSGTKAITIRGAAGNKIRQLHNYADNVTFDGVDVDANRGTPNGAVLELHGSANVTFKNGRVGNTIDQKGAVFGGWESTASQNLVIDNVEFHDVYQQGSEVHNECIFSQSPGLTIRNSTFRNCATMDLFILRGTWWGQPDYGGVTLENNVFGHSMNGNGWHYYSVYFASGTFSNMRAVNNTFENSVIFDDNNIGSGPYSGVWANNIGGGWSCLSGVTFRNNIGKACHTTDKATTPQNSCGPPACSTTQYQPVSWVDPANFDFHLKADSMAIDAGTATYAPARDKDGKARNGAPDVGAFER